MLLCENDIKTQSRWGRRRRRISRSFLLFRYIIRAAFEDFADFGINIFVFAELGEGAGWDTDFVGKSVFVFLALI